MRLWIIFILALIISGCSSTISSLDRHNKNLPQVKNIKTISDVSSIAFEWDVINNPNIKGYVLYRDSGDGFKEVAYIKNSIVTHYVDTMLTPESNYSYYFHTLSKDEYSSKSEIIKAKTSFIDPVESVYASNDYPKKVKLLWSVHINPSISHYLVQRKEENEFKTIAIVNNRLLVEYVDNDLNDESNYEYRIIAVDFIGNLSRPSKIVIAKTKNKPLVSSNIQATNNLPLNIVITWDLVNDAKNYKIYRSNTSDGAYNAIGTTSKTQFSDNIGTPNTSYYYKVSSIDSTDIESKLSRFAKGSTRSLPKTPKITKGYVDQKEAKIEWQGTNDAKHYVVYRKSGFFGETTKFKINDTSFVDKDMRVGKEYTYYVVSVDEFDLESSQSEEVALSIK